MARGKKAVVGAKKSPEVDQRLVAELKDLLTPLKIDVLGHVQSEALCCRNGTVAIVKIDRGDPAPRTAKSRTRAP